MKKIYFILFILTSCSSVQNLKSIDKEYLSIERNLKSFDTNNQFEVDIGLDELANLVIYKAGNELKKIYIDSPDSGITQIYFHKSQPILIIENFFSPTYHSFPSGRNIVTGNTNIMLEHNDSSSYKVYIIDWKKSKINFANISGVKHTASKFSKAEYQQLIEHVLVYDKKRY